MNGLLVLDKPAGLTSHDVVALVRRVTGERSIGHLGTLDPMATGVLPLLLGRYTRLAQFFGTAEKHYTGRIRFGHATDTYDAEGEATTPEQPLGISFEELQRLAGGFDGEMDQLPPIYSAKKIGGVPAHKLARAGVEVAVKTAKVTIHAFELTEFDAERSEVEFRMHISAGGYVRSVAHELGQKAGCGAHLASLRRTQAGAFTLAEAISVEELKALDGDPAGLAALLPHPRMLLPQMPGVTVDDRVAGQLRNGMQVNLPAFGEQPLVKVFTTPTELLAIARRIAGTLMQPMVVLG
ncbi:MAG: tRNA pseudouridine(55) synthase TruB [Acidobacteriaceae bacterium]